jgi:phosphatidate cytidylyltransferase
MSPAHWQVLLVYMVFTAIATLLALLSHWLGRRATGESVWRKYPTYILINLIFVAASWLPDAWHVLTVLLALLGGLAGWEIVRGLLSSKLPDGTSEGAATASAKPRTAGAGSAARTSWMRILPLISSALIALSDPVGMVEWIKIWIAVLLLFVPLAALFEGADQYGRRALALAGCLIYLPLCLACYVWLWRADEAGFRSVFLYLTVATNDAFAQITGQLLGRRAMAPRLSPGKTIEGALGGILFAIAMGWALGGATGLDHATGAALGLVLGSAGLAGDLTASAWKRALGLKDFSNLLGAQGGVLDRFDGLIFAAPVLYLLTAASSIAK